MNLKYLLGVFISIPLTPLMYIHGKRIRRDVPKLPEADERQGIAKATISTRKQLRLITIGESTIAGVGVKTHEEGFSGTLAKELAKSLDTNVHWRVYAHNGYTAQMTYEQMLPTIEERDLNLIVIGLGANDAFELNSPRKWKKGIRLTIETLQSKYPQTPIVFCNMPPIKEFPAFTSVIKFTIGNLVEILGQELDKLIKNYDNVFYCNEIITLEGWLDRVPPNRKKEEFFSDGVHPSKLAYQIWAKDVSKRIVENGWLEE